MRGRAVGTRRIGGGALRQAACSPEGCSLASAATAAFQAAKLAQDVAQHPHAATASGADFEPAPWEVASDEGDEEGHSDEKPGKEAEDDNEEEEEEEEEGEGEEEGEVATDLHDSSGPPSSSLSQLNAALALLVEYQEELPVMAATLKAVTARSRADHEDLQQALRLLAAFREEVPAALLAGGGLVWEAGEANGKPGNDAAMSEALKTHRDQATRELAVAAKARELESDSDLVFLSPSPSPPRSLPAPFPDCLVNGREVLPEARLQDVSAFVRKPEASASPSDAERHRWRRDATSGSVLLVGDATRPPAASDSRHDDEENRDDHLLRVVSPLMPILREALQKANPARWGAGGLTQRYQ